MWDYKNRKMNEKFLIFGLFFIFTPLLIFSQFYLLSYGGNYRQKPHVSVIDKNQTAVGLVSGSIFSSADVNNSQIDLSPISGDARPLLIKKYLQKYNSELEPYAELIFKASQEFGLDYRLIPAIAQQESNLCKKSPENCYNCWGVGIHSRGTMCFESYPEAINWLAKYLKEEYYDIGLNSVEEIMSKYCPLSSGTWAAGVNQFMSDIDKNE
jgi:hypothetical protein